jgi:hypothetical protein
MTQKTSKMKNNLLKSALAAASIALCAQSAHAQIVYSPGDLVLGVEATSGTGSTYDYEVDLGSIDLFTAGKDIDFSSTVLNADLSASSATGPGFGSTYDSAPTVADPTPNSANVFFSVVGDTANSDQTDTTYTGNGSGTLYKKAVFITAVTTPASQSGSGLSNTTAPISSVDNNLTGKTPTTTNGEAYFYSKGSAGSYTYSEYANGTSSEQFKQATDDQISLELAAEGTELPLYILNANGDNGTSYGTDGPVTELGYFTFENGDLKFDSSTPEPSTYALLLAGTVGLLALARRHTVKS